MSPEDYGIARDLKERLAAVIQLVDFRVYGSRARDDDDDDSDMDVFIEVEHLDKQVKKKIRDVIWDVGFENSIYISPLIFTRREIEDSPLRITSVVRNIFEEGVTV